MRANRYFFRFFLISWTLTGIWGCGGRQSPVVATQTHAVLKILGLQYGDYLVEHRGEAPPDDSAMAEYLKQRLKTLQEYGVTSVDQLLAAGRDGEPLQVVCGTKLVDPEIPSCSVAAYESAGLNGTRLVANTRGGVYELTAEEFAQRIKP